MTVMMTATLDGAPVNCWEHSTLLNNIAQHLLCAGHHSRYFPSFTSFILEMTV